MTLLNYILRKFSGVFVFKNQKKKWISLCTWMISRYMQKMKKNRPDSNNKNILLGCWMELGICHAHNEEWKRERTGGIELPNQESIRTFENYKSLGVLEADTIKKNPRRKKRKKGVPQKNKKTAGNQASQPKCHERNRPPRVGHYC